MKKLNKRNYKLAGIFGVSAIALASIGFANWVITGGNTEAEINEGLSVTAVDVNDQRSLKVEASVEDGDVTFGPSVVKDSPIQPSEGTSEENLDYVISVKLTQNSAMTIEEGDTIVTTYTFTSQIAELINGNYITFNGNSTITENTIEVNYEIKSTDVTAVEDNVLTITLTHTYGWGTKFGSKNPAEYATQEGANLDSIVNDLDHIYDTLQESNATAVTAKVQFNKKAAA